MSLPRETRPGDASQLHLRFFRWTLRGTIWNAEQAVFHNPTFFHWIQTPSPVLAYQVAEQYSLSGAESRPEQRTETFWGSILIFLMRSSSLLCVEYVSIRPARDDEVITRWDGQMIKRVRVTAWRSVPPVLLKIRHSQRKLWFRRGEMKRWGISRIWRTSPISLSYKYILLVTVLHVKCRKLNPYLNYLIDRNKSQIYLQYSLRHVNLSRVYFIQLIYLNQSCYNVQWFEKFSLRRFFCGALILSNISKTPSLFWKLFL